MGCVVCLLNYGVYLAYSLCIGDVRLKRGISYRYRRFDESKNVVIGYFFINFMVLRVRY